MSRFQIIIDGHHDADVTEFFPDPGDPVDPTVEDVDRVLSGVTLHEFLSVWNYQEDIEVTVTDTESGARWVTDHFGVFNRAEVSS